MSKNYLKDEVLEAMQNSGGIMSTVAKRLGGDWHTAEKYVLKFAETRKALADEENKVLDICQQSLIKSIKDGNTQDAKWYLSTKGKHRGFSEKIINEMTGKDGGPIETSNLAILKILEQYEAKDLIKIINGADKKIDISSPGEPPEYVKTR